MIKLCDILDISKIVTIISDTYSEDQLEGIELYLSMKMRRGKEHICLLSSNNKMVMPIERIDNYKCQFHLCRCQFV